MNNRVIFKWFIEMDYGQGTPPLQDLINQWLEENPEYDLIQINPPKVMGLGDLCVFQLRRGVE